jgi:hypothetical protein
LAVALPLGADRDRPAWAWSSPGAIMAGVGWLVVSVLFSSTCRTSAATPRHTVPGGGRRRDDVALPECARRHPGRGAQHELERQTEQGHHTRGSPDPRVDANAYAADTVAR